MKTCLFLVLASASMLASAAPVDAFAKAQRLVDIGGRKLNLVCSGTGAPTVVFEAQSGSAGRVWWDVQPKVAARTRACAYDRAGFGFSDAAPRQADLASSVDDLHALLRAAGEKGPYVMVGNSLGGGIALLYRWRYPDEVSGLVLIEPMHEEDSARANAASQGKMAAMEAQNDAMMVACTDQGAKGFVAGTELYDACIGGVMPSFPKALGSVDLQQRRTPAYWKAMRAEQQALPADFAQLRAARTSLGNLPLIVLARGVSPYAVPGQPQSDLNKATELANFSLQAETAALSKQGNVVVVAGAGHVVQETHPQAVVAAVDDVVERVRQGAK
ncbi:alpha/beta fold hydrolase [Massilia sp. S19_KUP03_FR1]|uniref:alpha/beta fold hydrolase n=1 Tax=Massilia sp. S19_KUP03_FR1 TaxID=3025503 RepID=UPI002FCCEE97